MAHLSANGNHQYTTTHTYNSNYTREGVSVFEARKSKTLAQDGVNGSVNFRQHD